MGKLLSMDLWSRALAAVDEGMSCRAAARRFGVAALHEARRDITLDELRRDLGQAGVSVAISTLPRFFARHGITRKKDRARDRAGPLRRASSQREE